MYFSRKNYRKELFIMTKFYTNASYYEKSEVEKHKIYKRMCEASYDDLKMIQYYNENIVDIKKSEQTGFCAYAIENNNELVIVVRGSDEVNDYKNDFKMLVNKIPYQLYELIDFYDSLASKYGASNIVVVGHSLGGSLAQMLAIKRPVKSAVTFLPWGCKNIIKNNEFFKSSQISLNDIINYCSMDDIFTVRNIGFNIGKCYLIKGNAKFVDNHFLENLDDLQTRELINPQKYLSKFQNFNIGLNDNIKKVCNGIVNVGSYVKQNGTHVKEYVRRCGANHKSKEQYILDKYKGKRFQDLSNEEINEVLEVLI